MTKGKRYYGADAPRSTGPHPDQLADEMEAARTRDTMDKIYAMTPDEVNQFLGDHFRRLCSKKIP